VTQDAADNVAKRAGTDLKRPSPFSYLFAVLIVLGIAGYVVTDWLVVTDREKIRAVIQDARLCVVRRDVQGLRRLFTEHCRVKIDGLRGFTGHKGFEILELAHFPAGIRIRNLKVHPLKTLAKGSLIAEISGYGERAPRAAGPCYVKFEMRLAGGKWKFSDVVVQFE